MAGDIKKNRWEELLKTLPEEERISVSKFETLGDFLEWSYTHEDLVTDPFGTWDSKKDLVAPENAAPQVKSQPSTSRFSRIFRRRGAQKPVQQTGTPTAWTPFPQNVSGGGQASTISPGASGFRNRLSYFGPRSIARRARGKIMGSRLGKRISGSRLGRLAGIANRLGGMASGLKRKINNLLNPLSYLQQLFKRVFFGAIASAIGGFASAVVTAIVNTVIVVGTFTLGAIAFILGKIAAGIGIALAAVSLPWAVVLAIIIFLLVALFGILFGDPSAKGGTPPEQSPYPGILYSKTGPTRVPNGTDIEYTIILSHDSTSASCPLGNIILVDDIPPRTTLVQGSGLTTGDYTFIDGFVRWKLSLNTSSPPSETTNSFAFTLTLRPQDDITITNRIFIEGCN